MACMWAKMCSTNDSKVLSRPYLWLMVPLYSCDYLHITVGCLTPEKHTFSLNLMYLSRDKMYCMITYLLTYLLTPWSRVLLEKLTGFQLFKKFAAFYGTRRFITTVTSARHLSLFWASSIQSIPPHPISWRSIWILSSHLCLGLPKWSLSFRFPHQNPAWLSSGIHHKIVRRAVPIHFENLIYWRCMDWLQNAEAHTGFWRIWHYRLKNIWCISLLKYLKQTLHFKMWRWVCINLLKFVD